MKTNNSTKMILTRMTKSFIMCLMMLIGSQMPAMAAAKPHAHCPKSYMQRSHAHVRPSRSAVFLARHKKCRHHYVAKHRCWLANNAVCNIVAMGKNGTKCLVVKVK